MTDEEVESKFLSLTKKFLTMDQARRVMRLVWRLEREENISELLRATVSRKR
jgi:hypothetical protein